MIAQAGHLPLPRSTADFVELLPSAWRRINQEGVTFDNRVYDTAALNPYRQANSGVKAQNGRRELHHDPYVTAVWIRNHHTGGWITATWIHRDLVAQPFSAAIYEHVRARSTAAGTPVRDDYIARRVAEMLNPGTDAAQQSPTDRRLVATERNNPPRPPHLIVVRTARKRPPSATRTANTDRATAARMPPSANAKSARSSVSVYSTRTPTTGGTGDLGRNRSTDHPRRLARIR